MPIFLKAWEKLQCEPDIVFFDGQGVMPILEEWGLLLMLLFIEKPTIGIAKSKLIGDFVEPGYKKEGLFFLYHKTKR